MPSRFNQGNLSLSWLGFIKSTLAPQSLQQETAHVMGRVYAYLRFNRLIFWDKQLFKHIIAEWNLRHTVGIWKTMRLTWTVPAHGSPMMTSFKCWITSSRIIQNDLICWSNLLTSEPHDSSSVSPLLLQWIGRGILEVWNSPLEGQNLSRETKMIRNSHEANSLRLSSSLLLHCSNIILCRGRDQMETM